LATQRTELIEQLVEVLKRPDGATHLRPVHATGNGARGFFTPSPVAAAFCQARNFTDERTPVEVRFSNGSGGAMRRDGWSDVRGMAVKFRLLDGTSTDLVMMTLREFFSRTPEEFVEFAIAAKPAKFSRATPWRKFRDYLALRLPMRDPYPGETIRPDEGAVRFAGINRNAQLGVFDAGPIGAPVSYARAAYHAVHTFIVTGGDGVRRWVRFNWQPAEGVLTTNPEATPNDAYLEADMIRRLAENPVRFSLMMVIGEVGDDFDDPTKPWPPHRQRVFMGTLTLDSVMDAAETERLAFNPMALTPGIAASDDAVLRIRKDVYDLSADQRSKAKVCPFADRSVSIPPPGWLDRFVDSLPERGWFKFLSTHVVVPFWGWREPKSPLEGGARPAPQPSENLQRMMNLIMPLKDSSPVGRAKAALAIAQNVDAIFAGLDNVGTVHTARFLLLDDKLCMISTYDGDFSNYIRDFIATIGNVFDEIMTLVIGGGAQHPANKHLATFMDCGHKHDPFRAPAIPPRHFPLQDAASGRPADAPPHPLRDLPRSLILQFRANPNISLGGGYRAYPGVSAAQVRERFGIGW